MASLKTFQDIILTLQHFWTDLGCCLMQPYDTEKGAGTMSPYTFLHVLGPKPLNVAYVEPSRRPTDGRYGKNPNRLQHYFQFQVIQKPSPIDIQERYIQSLEALGISRKHHDIRFVEDNWEAPTLGAWGVGWEVWLNGMEVTQFTYFQQCGGFDCDPIPVEITYGLERLCMFIQNKSSVYDLIWQTSGKDMLTYGDLYHTFEVEQNHLNFQLAHVDALFKQFEMYANQANVLLDNAMVFPAYDYCLKCSHTFNLLDARSAISVSERAHYIGKVRALAKRCAATYLEKHYA